MPATVYYYPPPHHVLKNLADGRIKISSFARCNDPFELAGFNMQRGARYWYRAMNEAGLLNEDDMVVREFVMGTGQASACRSDA